MRAVLLKFKERNTKMKKLTKKEKAFCVGFINSGDIAEAQAYAGVTDGGALLCREEIRDELKRLSRVYNESVAYTASAGLKKLAIGDISDAVRLLYEDNPDSETLRNMDFFMISEIRRKENSVEIKFYDRIKALSQLGENTATESEGSIYEALMASVDGDNDED